MTWTSRDRIGKVRFALTCRDRRPASGPLSAFNDVKSGGDGITTTHQFSAVLRTIGVATTNLHAGCEQAFARYMIDLQPRTVRILKQHRIVAGAKLSSRGS